MTTGQTVQCHRQHIPTTMTMANMSRIWGESKIQRYYTHNAVVVTTITMTTCMHAHTCTKLLGTRVQWPNPPSQLHTYMHMWLCSFPSLLSSPHLWGCPTGTSVVSRSRWVHSPYSVCQLREDFRIFRANGEETVGPTHREEHGGHCCSTVVLLGGSCHPAQWASSSACSQIGQGGRGCAASLCQAGYAVSCCRLGTVLWGVETSIEMDWGSWWALSSPDQSTERSFPSPVPPWTLWCAFS